MHNKTVFDKIPPLQNYLTDSRVQSTPLITYGTTSTTYIPYIPAFRVCKPLCRE